MMMVIEIMVAIVIRMMVMVNHLMIVMIMVMKMMINRLMLVVMNDNGYDNIVMMVMIMVIVFMMVIDSNSTFRARCLVSSSKISRLLLSSLFTKNFFVSVLRSMFPPSSAQDSNSLFIKYIS
jgi:hypothetical protein